MKKWKRDEEISRMDKRLGDAGESAYILPHTHPFNKKRLQRVRGSSPARCHTGAHPPPPPKPDSVYPDVEYM
jgi:hypothetical protein